VADEVAVWLGPALSWFHPLWGRDKPPQSRKLSDERRTQNRRSHAWGQGRTRQKYSRGSPRTNENRDGRGGGEGPWSIL